MIRHQIYRGAHNSIPVYVSDFAINFGSTTIEECVMHNVPLINFDVKPAVRNGSKRPYRVTHEYLYDYNYCIQLRKDFSQAQFSAAVSYLTSTDLTEEFKKARQNHLFDHKDSCKRILDVLPMNASFVVCCGPEIVNCLPTPSWVG